MKEFGGWFLPDGEVHLIDWMKKVNDQKEGRYRYQGKKYDVALSFCKQRRVAVDCGAHVGLMSHWMSKDFEQVKSFEPVAAHRQCFVKNVALKNVMLFDCALGEQEGSVSIHTAPTSSGDSWISGVGDIPLKMLDWFEFENVDFIKLDTEGHELPALRGAEQTIKRCRPCVMVEQKPGHAQRFGFGETDAVPYLESLGASVRKIMSGDYIMSFD